MLPPPIVLNSVQFFYKLHILAASIVSKTSHHNAFVVVVPGLLVVSHSPHQRMEFAQLQWNYMANFHFTENFKDFMSTLV